MWYEVLDSEVIVHLICAAYGDPLAAMYRELAPWVPEYHALLLGWTAIIWIIRQSSHGLALSMHEADVAAAHPWPRIHLWFRKPLRFTIRSLNGPPSYKYKQVLNAIVQLKGHCIQ